MPRARGLSLPAVPWQVGYQGLLERDGHFTWRYRYVHGDKYDTILLRELMVLAGTASMTQDIFLEYITNFAETVQERPLLLIVDNHESRLYVSSLASLATALHLIVMAFSMLAAHLPCCSCVQQLRSRRVRALAKNTHSMPSPQHHAAATTPGCLDVCTIQGHFQPPAVGAL